MRTNKIMAIVFLALLPAFLVRIYYWGYGTLFTFLTALATSLVIEFLSPLFRKKKLISEVKNNSALVTVMLLALSLPPSIPAFVVVICTIFSILIAKQVYGGMGQNIFNPAMVGMAVFIITYPQFVASYADLADASKSFTLTDTVNTFLNREAAAYTGATPLTELKALIISEKGFTATLNKALERLDNSPWLIYSLATLVGGLYLAFRRIAKWAIIIPVFVGFGLVASLHMLFGNETVYLYSSYNYASLILCAFFIATDPVTAPQMPKGQIIFALTLGALVYIIRAFSSYNDGVAFAVLLSNMLTPLLDTHIKPKEFGK